MSTITPSEWSQMTPDTRRRAIGDMTQTQAAELYANMSSNRNTGPRLNRGEWAALGNTGQQWLLRDLPSWESEILYSWGVAEVYAPKVLQIPDDECIPISGGWSKKVMHNLLFWSCVIPPLGLIVFVFNFWRPGRFAQSIGLLASGLLMFFIGYPAVCGFIAAIAAHFAN
jgi:hypothetical protein